jgi:hypothetical protein
MLKNLKTQALLPVLAAGLLFGFQNCGAGLLQTSSTSSPSFTEGDGSMNLVSNDKVAVGVNYSENVLASMLSATGVTPDATTLQSYADKKTKIAESGKPESVTSPMWMAITNLAGDVCMNLVTQEKALPAASRGFYNLVDFAAGPTKLSAAAKADVVRRMARSFWGRNETPQEKTVIVAAMDDAFSAASDNGTETENEMLFVCTALLSSLDTHKQ